MSDDDTVARLNAALEGRYRVQEELGEGGMATVYLAEDLRHRRNVALKVLRPELAAVVGGERFLAEIETTANLQHPHILPLFDSGEADRFLFYVMPYVEGESLRDRLERDRQLPVEEAVEIARKVGSALQYAHEQGVIHRDIKPANILLSRGEPLVADFGIALALTEAGGGRITETGLSLGTPHYMSPEQAAGERALDVRSDVYALGCILYEMLAGQPPYGGPTAQAVLAQILTEEPRKVTDFRRTVPPHVAAVVTRSLEKLPADRFASVEAFQKALRDESFRYEPTVVAAATAAARPWGAPAGGETRPWITDPRSWAALGAAAVLALFALVQVFGGFGASALPGTGAPSHRYVLARPSTAATPGVSVDGTVAYADEVEGEAMIRVRFAGRTESQVLPGTEGAIWMDFSPDGEWIAFAAGAQTLKKIPTVGGPVVTLARGAGPGSILVPAWSDDGHIYFWDAGGLHRVADVVGESEQVLEASAGEARLPRPLPGGEAILFTSFQGSDLGSARVDLLDLETGETRTVIENGVDARWSPTGHLLYGHESGALFAAPFDLEGREVTGPGAPVLDSLLIQPWGLAAFGMSRTGRVAYMVGGATSGTFSFVVVDTAGQRNTLPLDPSDHVDGRYSPDGRRIAYIREDNVFIYDVDLGTNARFTFEGTNHHDPTWSPDGERIVFTSAREGSESPPNPPSPSRAAGSCSACPASSVTSIPTETAFSSARL